jgi:amidase
MAAAPYVGRLPRAWAADASFDPAYGTATEAARAIRSGTISSRELVELAYRRIEKHNPTINAFITLREEDALQEAKQADEALVKGRPLGPLHGLPIVLKDLSSTAGIRTTFGSKWYKNYVPTEDAPPVARLRHAGAIIIGKTSLPSFGDDHQTYNEIVGLTKNPWDPARSPGGSTGGGAAALAAGIGFLELGSDLGGSIRNPAHFCGIYGHKPTFDLVPRIGPRAPGFPIASWDSLWVKGPLARSARDLQLELEVVAGPISSEAIAYGWKLPPPRGTRLKDYRIGFVLTDPFCPPSSEVAAVIARAVEAMRSHGVRMDEGWPKGIDFPKAFEDYFFLMVNSAYQKEEELEKRIDRLKGNHDYYSVLAIQAYSASYQQWRVRDGARAEVRAIWREYFRDHDAFIMPANFCAAFPHTLAEDWSLRAIETNDGKRAYLDLVRWMTMPTLSGCPATVAPAGRTPQGLPVGIQIMGPYLEDATSIDIAGQIADVVGGFVPPPGY